MAPPLSVVSGEATTRSGSTRCSLPSPSQAGQAPCGLLNEKSRGSISGIVKPETGQANFSEKISRFGSPFPSVSPPASSATAMPSARASAVSKESARRDAMSPRTTMRSTTTSMSCLYFLSSAGTSGSSWNSPSTLTRWKPFFCSSASSLRYSPLRPRTIGASR